LKKLRDDECRNQWLKSSPLSESWSDKSRCFGWTVQYYSSGDDSATREVIHKLKAAGHPGGQGSVICEVTFILGVPSISSLRSPVNVSEHLDIALQ